MPIFQALERQLTANGRERFAKLFSASLARTNLSLNLPPTLQPIVTTHACAPGLIRGENGQPVASPDPSKLCGRLCTDAALEGLFTNAEAGTVADGLPPVFTLIR